VPELEPARPPDKHCLLVDQGSSRIKWIGAIWSAMSRNWGLDVTTHGEGGLQEFATALDSGELLPPEEVLLCSVADPDRVSELEVVIAERSSAPVVRSRSEVETCGVRNGYREPEQLGADRWMTVVAAAGHHGLPLVVMDLGTATTLDAVDAEGQHHGGLILPGPGTMLGALGDATALRLDAEASRERPKRKAGRAQTDTRSAVQGGILASHVGVLHEFIHWFEEQLGAKDAGEMKLLVTGGGAGVILGQSDYQLTHDPLLVFKGMLICRFGPGDH